jgi:hypothetical protein
MPTRAALFGYVLATDSFIPAAEDGLLAASLQVDLLVGCTVVAGASMDEDGTQGFWSMLPHTSNETIAMATWRFLPVGSHDGYYRCEGGGEGYRRDGRVQ